MSSTFRLDEDFLITGTSSAHEVTLRRPLAVSLAPKDFGTLQRHAVLTCMDFAVLPFGPHFVDSRLHSATENFKLFFKVLISFSLKKKKTYAETSKLRCFLASRLLVVNFLKYRQESYFDLQIQVARALEQHNSILDFTGETSPYIVAL